MRQRLNERSLPACSGARRSLGCGGGRWGRVRSAIAHSVTSTAAAATAAAAWIAISSTASAAPAVPAGSRAAHHQGRFGPTFAWPVMPIHSALLPDGKVLAYGSGLNGRQGATLYYAVWNPAAGIGPESMTVLDNRTGTDVFCSATSLLPSGQVLVLGGSRAVGSVRNYANNHINVFDPVNLTLTRQPEPMRYQRWYASLLTTAQGEQLVLGGRDDRLYAGDPDAPATVPSYSRTPELLHQGQPWRTLELASSPQAWLDNWYYPKAWQTSRGPVVMLGNDTALYTLDTQGSGSLSRLPTTAPLPSGDWLLPAVMFTQGKLLGLRNGGHVVVVDLHSTPAKVRETAALDQVRYYAHATVLADGRVWVNGGSSSGNSLAGAAYTSQLWSPGTDRWKPAARSAWPRLYHSSSLLLADGTVLTGGGGSPGPLTLLNGEIYYPPYLYAPDGQPAVRPRLDTAPVSAQYGQALPLTLQAPATIERIHLIRMGAATHNSNVEQRLIPLRFSQNGLALSATLPASAGIMPPGYYLLFVLDEAGVPSTGKVIRIDTPAPGQAVLTGAGPRRR